MRAPLGCAVAWRLYQTLNFVRKAGWHGQDRDRACSRGGHAGDDCFRAGCEPARPNRLLDQLIRQSREHERESDQARQLQAGERSQRIGLPEDEQRPVPQIEGIADPTDRFVW